MTLSVLKYHISIYQPYRKRKTYLSNTKQGIKFNHFVRSLNSCIISSGIVKLTHTHLYSTAFKHYIL